MKILSFNWLSDTAVILLSPLGSLCLLIGQFEHSNVAFCACVLFLIVFSAQVLTPAALTTGPQQTIRASYEMARETVSPGVIETVHKCTLMDEFLRHYFRTMILFLLFENSLLCWLKKTAFICECVRHFYTAKSFVFFFFRLPR